ncbi:MAG: hypothetical protein J6K21_04725 [Bacilli bacterium]|nr:hypothetical protein [Bacilli bacterium]
MREQLNEYVSLYNSFDENPHMTFTEEQLKLIEEVKVQALTNIELANLLKQIEISSPIERENLVNNYLLKQNNSENYISDNTMVEDINLQYSNNQNDSSINIPIVEKEEHAKQKVKVKSTGYIDVLLLSIITGFLGGVLTTLTMILIK